MPEPAPPALPAPAPDPAFLPPPPAAGRADPLGRDTGRRAELRRLRREWLAERDVARRRARAKRPWQMLLLLALGLSLAPATVAVSSRTRLDPTAVAMATRFLCPHGGTPQRAVNGRRGGRCVPATGGLGDDSELRGWDTGLPAPNRAQIPCPVGTQAAPSAQPGAVRCVPG